MSPNFKGEPDQHDEKKKKTEIEIMANIREILRGDSAEIPPFYYGASVSGQVSMSSFNMALVIAIAVNVSGGDEGQISS